MPRAYDGLRWRDVEVDVRRRHSAGEGRDAVADALGLSRATLQKWCVQAGLRFDARGRAARPVGVVTYSMDQAVRLLREEIASARAEIDAGAAPAYRGGW
jgi:predicted transcriptional regulator